MALIDTVKAKVKDDSGRLTDPADYTPAVAAALERYSKDRPGVRVLDASGAGMHDVDLPDEWVEEFSQLRRVEYPVDLVPAAVLSADRWSVYQAPDGPVLRLLDYMPAADQAVRLTITVPRIEAEIVSGDLDAVADLAAAICCETLASLFAQTSDPTIAADVVNYRTKSAEFSARAKRFRQLYLDHMGIDESGGAPASLTVAPPPARSGLTHWRS